MKKILENLAEVLMKSLAFILLPFLAYGLYWFVVGVLHPENYAPPTRSVSLIGIFLSAVCWVLSTVRHSALYEKDRRWWNSKFFIWASVAFCVAYLVVPTWGRVYLNDKGRYWELVDSDGKSHYEVTHTGLGGPQGSSYPRWAFGWKARNPINIQTGATLQISHWFDPNSFKYEITENKEFSAHGTPAEMNIQFHASIPETPENILSLSERAVTKDMLDSLVMKEVAEIIQSAPITVEECSDGKPRDININGYTNPLLRLNPELTGTSFKLHCSFRKLEKPVVIQI